MTEHPPNIIIYNSIDGKASVALYAKDGKIWLNQQQMAELFATSKPNISMHISNILKEKELSRESVVKDYLTTAAVGKNYNVVFYSLEMILAVGYRVRGVRAFASPQRTFAEKRKYMPTNNKNAFQRYMYLDPHLTKVRQGY